jgi:hypothetical protein
MLPHHTPLHAAPVCQASHCAALSFLLRLLSLLLLSLLLLPLLLLPLLLLPLLLLPLLVLLLLLPGSLDRTVRLWDLKYGMPLSISGPHGSTVRSVALDAQLVASGSSDNVVRLWHARNATEGASLLDPAAAAEAAALLEVGGAVLNWLCVYCTNAGNSQQAAALPCDTWLGIRYWVFQPAPTTRYLVYVCFNVVAVNSLLCCTHTGMHTVQLFLPLCDSGVCCRWCCCCCCSAGWQCARPGRGSNGDGWTSRCRPN